MSVALRSSTTIPRVEPDSKTQNNIRHFSESTLHYQTLPQSNSECDLNIGSGKESEVRFIFSAALSAILPGLPHMPRCLSSFYIHSFIWRLGRRVFHNGGAQTLMASKFCSVDGREEPLGVGSQPHPSKIAD